MQHDLIVIGSGAVAAGAAAEGARLGLKVLLARPPGVGGGERTRLQQAFASRLVADRSAARRAARPLGRTAWGRLTSRIDASAEEYLRSLGAELEVSSIQIASGPTRLLDARTVNVAGTLHRADAVVLAVGTRARHPARFPFDDITVLDPGSVLQSPRPLRSLAVVGAAEEGCEIASLFAALGTSVMLLDRRTRLLRGIERDVLQQLHVEMQRAGVEVALEEEISEIRSHPNEPEPYVVIELSSGRVETLDAAVVCAGRIPDLEGVDTGALSLDMDVQTFLSTDDRGRTSQPGLYAIGEGAGMPIELGVQVHAARAVVRLAAGFESHVEDHLPCTLHTIPEISFVGLSEEACQRLGVAFAVGVSPLLPAVPGATPGLLKIIAARETREVLGMHAIGARASETIYTAIALLRSGSGVDQLAQALFAIPSASEAIRLAASRATAALPLGPRALASAETPWL